MAVYVVTGGAGFIGSNLVVRLVAEGEEVRVVDDFSTGRRESLWEPTPVGARRAVPLLFEGSICDGDLLRQAFEGADFVLHQAALPSVQRSVKDPLAANQVNVEGTLNVLLAARDCGVKRVVYASSSSVYGDVAELPKREDMTPSPMSPYAVSKLTGEYYCRVFNDMYGLETVSLRYFNVFGPRQSPESQYAAVIPIFVGCILAGKSPQVFGDGEQSRDFTFIDDVVAANLLAARAEGAAGRVCNVGAGERHTLNELLELLQRIIGKRVQPRYCEERAGDVKHSQAAISAAREYLGYEPQVSFEDGLRHTVEWYKQRESTTLFFPEG